jgi:hypothetical protein
MPGLLGGLAAIFVVHGLNVTAQISGIVTTIIIAIATGLVTGKALSLLGSVAVPYDDAVEFLDVEAEPQVQFDYNRVPERVN